MDGRYSIEDPCFNPTVDTGAFFSLVETDVENGLQGLPLIPNGTIRTITTIDTSVSCPTDDLSSDWEPVDAEQYP
jgi:hypothetical protein